MQSVRQVANACMTSRGMSKNTPTPRSPLHIQFQEGNAYAIAVSPVSGNVTTSNVRSASCVPGFPSIRSSATLGPVSTSSVGDCSMFWSSQTKELSKRLWLPTATVSAGSPSTSWNGSFEPMESGSWFSINRMPPPPEQNSLMTSWQSSRCSAAELTAVASTVNVEMIARKLRLYPDAPTAAKLRRWFGCVRATYNMALHRINTHPKTPKSMYWLRNRFVNACNVPKAKAFLLETPKHVREGGIADLALAFKTNFAKHRIDPSHTFNIAYRSKKSDQSIVIPKSAIKLIDQGKEMQVYPKMLSAAIKHRQLHLPEGLTSVPSDCRLTMSKDGIFHLCIPCRRGSAFARENQPSEKKSKHMAVYDSSITSEKGGQWASIDPGVRTFATVYSPNGTLVKLGDRDIERIAKLLVGLSKLQSRHDRCIRHKSKRNMRRAMVRARRRIKHLVDEVHHKAACWLTSRFEHVIIPPFQTSRMVKRSSRKIGKKTVRDMLCWAHYTFRQRLIAKGCVTGTNIYVRSEAWTTKTCTRCGHVKHNIGGAKRFTCSECGLDIDRDAAGARNIFLRNVQLTLCNQQSQNTEGPSHEKTATSGCGVASLKPGRRLRAPSCKTSHAEQNNLVPRRSTVRSATNRGQGQRGTSEE